MMNTVYRAALVTDADHADREILLVQNFSYVLALTCTRKLFKIFPGMLLDLIMKKCAVFLPVLDITGAMAASSGVVLGS